jgi:VanZ family protein
MSAQRPGPAEAPRPFFLARLALALVAMTIAYASLRPFHGWRDAGRHPFDYLVIPGEFGSPFDAILNVAGYLPFGACLALALFPRLQGGKAFFVGALVPALFSVLVEAAQTYLPGRVASVVDLGMNTLGAILGAALAVACTPWLADHRGGRRLRERWLVPGRLAEVGLLLLAAWWVAFFAQGTLLFGTGDFRGNLQVSVDPSIPAIVYGVTEVFVVAANVVVVGILLRLVLAEGVPRMRWLLVTLAGALVVRVVAQLAFWQASAAWRWITPAALIGLAVGVGLAAPVMNLPRRVAAMTAVVLLVASLIVINLAPPDPALWLQRSPPREHMLIGLILVGRYASKMWPFVAMLYLMLVLQRTPGRR